MTDGSTEEGKKRKREGADESVSSSDKTETPLTLPEMTRAREKLLANSEREKQVVDGVIKSLEELTGLLKGEVDKGDKGTYVLESDWEGVGLAAALSWISSGGVLEGEVVKKGEEAQAVVASYSKGLIKGSAASRKKEQKGGGVAGTGGFKELKAVVDTLTERVRVLESKVSEVEKLKQQVAKLQTLIDKS